jgi:RNA-binding protein YlmH
MNMDKDEQIFKKHLMDLANSADRKGICIFSDFLNLNEQNLFLSIKQELPRIKYFAYGGFQDAERKILCFCGEETIAEQDEITFPITCIKIEPLNQKITMI